MYGADICNLRSGPILAVLIHSLLRSRCPPECYLQSETTMEPGLRLRILCILHSFFLYGLGFDLEVKKACYLAYNEHFTQSNIFSENVFPLFSVSHYSVLSLEIIKED